MANKKVTALTELTAVSNTDMLYVVDDPSGSPIGKKTTIDSALAAFDHGCWIYETGDGSQDLVTETFTPVTFDTENKDTDAYHDTGSNTSRITIPSGQAGVYFLEGVITWNVAFSGDKMVRIYLNGIAGTILVGTRTSLATGITHTVATVYELAETDYVELVAWHNRGSNAALNMATEGIAHFRAQRLA